ncbi:MAG: SAM-dependent chlorinase/fluorinase [Deltaproteobacteria bacterium]|nr:SAM-dependent chlorinase/fluorinase [Deltaproteobacteria bacterium]
MTDKSPSGLVTFLSDFGTSDSYVAEVKGAILSIDDGLRVLDVTHNTPRHDVRHAAFLLLRVKDAFQSGAVHLAVVDPGVGTSRRPVLVEADGHLLVGPDNGLLSWAVRGVKNPKWRMIDRPDLYRVSVSSTFHGRDLFAPVAGALASGMVKPEDCGPLIDDPVLLPWPLATIKPQSASGEVLTTDRFGNLIVGIPAGDLLNMPDEGAPVTVVVNSESFEAVWGPYGKGSGVVVHGDSSGFIEVAVAGGSARKHLRAQAGSALEVRWSH